MLSRAMQNSWLNFVSVCFLHNLQVWVKPVLIIKQNKWKETNKERQKKVYSIKTESVAKNKQMENLLWVWRAACTKQGWSVSFNISWVNAMSPACSIKPRLSATCAANASPRFCRAPSRAWVSEAWRSARAAVRSLMLWASCSLADTLFTWWWKAQ